MDHLKHQKYKNKQLKNNFKKNLEKITKKEKYKKHLV